MIGHQKVLLGVLWLLLAGCQSYPDLRQELAGTDTLEIIFQDKQKNDTIIIRHRGFIKKIVQKLHYKTAPTLALPAQAHLSFLRKNIQLTLLAGTLHSDTAQMVFQCTHQKKTYQYMVGKEARDIIAQARKYPSLLREPK